MIRTISIAAACLAVFGTGTTALVHPVPRLLWNASASVPLGLYAVHPPGRLHVGELLVIQPPKAIAAYLGDRGYLPRGVPLLKHAAALPGQTVCRRGDAVTVDGAAVGLALDRDHLGRPLPFWQGCRPVEAGQVFLLNPDAPASFDSRYFGAVDDTSIIGRADPLWLTSGARR